jgi:uncharacterized protein (TIGR01244 family)
MKRNALRDSRHATLAALVILFALSGAMIPAQQAGTSATGIKNFGKVNDNYYRGSQPMEADVAQLKKLGIKTVIDLRGDFVEKGPTWVRNAGMQYFNIPMKASRPATDEQVNYFLSLVNDPKNWPVYVHCKGGRHRTGALTAVYRITNDGWTADQAYKEMKEYDFEHGIFGGPTAQKRFVYSFYERHTAQSGQR